MRSVPEGQCNQSQEVLVGGWSGLLRCDVNPDFYVVPLLMMAFLCDPVQLEP